VPELSSLLVIAVISVFVVTGCADTRQDPCELLTNKEVRVFDEDAVKSVWMPLGKDKTNELCMFVDINDEPVLMLFSWNYGGADPEETVSRGMQEDGRVVHIRGVGEDAVAGFKGQDMKLFAARSSGGMVGFRARGISSEDSDEFGVIKDLANKALLRLH